MFFEDPALLVGVPLLIVGILGVLVTLGTLFSPDPALQGQVVHRGHPDQAEYIKVGAFLGIVTAIEVVIYYFDIPRSLFVTVLIALSTVKFAVVVMWFMHLRFDSKIFTTAFVTGLVLAGAIFTVVIATLGSNLV